MPILLTAFPLRHFTGIKFTLDPESKNTTLNSTVNFTCEATPVEELNFRVNDESANHRVVMDKGFTQSTKTNGSGTTRIGTLQAIARGSNNNTNITCRATNDDPAVNYSDTALLLIQGSECLF